MADIPTNEAPSTNHVVDSSVVISAVYKVLLGRDISSLELADRVRSFEGRSAEEEPCIDLINSVLDSVEFSFAINQLTQKHRLLAKKTPWQSLDVVNNIALVFAPTESWLPFRIVVADYLMAEYAVRSLLVCDGIYQQVTNACFLSTSILDVIKFSDIDCIPEQFIPTVIATHSFGWPELNETLLKRFSYTPLIVYGDGYKNLVSFNFDAIRPIHEVLYFGYNNNAWPLSNAKVLSSSDVTKFRDSLAHLHPFNNVELNREPDQYAVLYLRYWGIDYYSALDDEGIAECFAMTAIRNTKKDTVIIIKGDGRAKPEQLAAVERKILAAGYTALNFADYIVQIGGDPQHLEGLPAEYFYTHGLLCNAVAHFVLDSSLAYIIATDPYIKRPTHLYIGPDGNTFESFGASKGRETVLDYTQLYKDAVLKSSEVIGKELISRDGELPIKILLRNGT